MFFFSTSCTNLSWNTESRRKALWSACYCTVLKQVDRMRKKWQIYTLISKGNDSSWDFKVRLKGFVLPPCTTTKTAATTIQHRNTKLKSLFLLFLCLLLNTVSVSVKATVVQVSEPFNRWYVSYFPPSSHISPSVSMAMTPSSFPKLHPKLIAAKR